MSRPSPATFIFLCALLVFPPACAVVGNGLHQDVAIASVPAGATVSVDGREVGVTPVTVSLSRAHSHEVELRKPGFATVRQNVRAHDDEYMRRPVRFGLDIDSGAANELTPSAVNVELVPDAPPSAAAGDTFDQMTTAVLVADSLLRRGEISEAAHREMIEKIITRFGH